MSSIDIQPAAKEVLNMNFSQDNNNNVFDLFYHMLKEITHCNQKNSVAASTVLRDGKEYEKMLADLETPHIPFSGDECDGRYVDLHEFYHRYINSKFGHPMSYTEYLGNFPGIDEEDMIPSRLKTKRQYRDYMADVLDYLVSFLERTQPLMFLDRIFKNLESEFEEQCKSNRGKKRARVSDNEVDLDEYQTIESLMGLGNVKLKEALDARGLKSGGTVQQRAERLLFARNNPINKLEEKKLFKIIEEKGEERRKETALIEAKVRRLCEMLTETIEQTRQHVLNRQAMTLKERIDDDVKDNEDDSMPIEEELSSDREVYNPLKLPLGWDKKPIPYWLYKLHGLGQEFDCEICGNHKYKGRRVFELHFNESRHKHGLRCLGITTNTKNFHEITSIDDAIRLWEEIKMREQASKWQPDLYEEQEDAEG